MSDKSDRVEEAGQVDEAEELDDAGLRHAALMWAFVVQRQADRLYEAVGDLNAAMQDQYLLGKGDAGELDDAWLSYVEHEVGTGLSWEVYWASGADMYFFLAAAAQLEKCVSELVDDGLPAVPYDNMIRLLRNFTEHWEDPTRSAKTLRKTHPDAVPGRMAYTKHDIEIEGVSMYGIVEWSIAVDQALRDNAARTGDVLPERLLDPPPK